MRSNIRTLDFAEVTSHYFCDNDLKFEYELPPTSFEMTGMTGCNSPNVFPITDSHDLTAFIVSSMYGYLPCSDL